MPVDVDEIKAGLAALGAGKPADVLPPAATHVELVRQLAARPDRAEARIQAATLTARLIMATGKGLQLGEADLAGLDLSGFDLRRANLNRAQLHGTDLTDCDLGETSLICPAMERTKFIRASLRGAYTHALAAQVCDFRDADLTGITDGTGSLFHGCYFQGATLAGVMLSGSSFYQTNFDGAVFDGANLQGCQFLESSAVDASLRRTQLDDAVFTKVDLGGAVFAGATGTNMVIQRPFSFDGVDLTGASLQGLRLAVVHADNVNGAALTARGADIRDCNFTGLVLAGADLAESSWLRVTAVGANLENAVADNSRWVSCTLDGARLVGLKAENWQVVECSARRADLTGVQGRCAHIRNSVLTDAEFTSAYLYRAMITGDPPVSMDLRGTRFTNAVLVQAYLAANLEGATLHNVRLAYGRLNQARLARADLRGAHLFQCTLVKTDFTEAELAGVAGTVLADRCPGLESALVAAGDASASTMLEQVVRLREALDHSDRRST